MTPPEMCRLKQLEDENGNPRTIRVDQDSEFVSCDLDLWAYTKGITLDFSRPGKPTDNAFIEAHVDRFCGFPEALVIIDQSNRAISQARRPAFTDNRTIGTSLAGYRPASAYLSMRFKVAGEIVLVCFPSMRKILRVLADMGRRDAAKDAVPGEINQRCWRFESGARYRALI